jgi:hypothetical protein
VGLCPTGIGRCPEVCSEGTRQCPEVCSEGTRQCPEGPNNILTGTGNAMRGPGYVFKGSAVS